MASSSLLPVHGIGNLRRFDPGLPIVAHQRRGLRVDDPLVDEVVVAVPAGLGVLVGVDQQQHPVLAGVRRERRPSSPRRIRYPSRSPATLQVTMSLRPESFL